MREEPGDVWNSKGDKIVRHTQNNCQNYVDKTVVKLVQKQLSNSNTFHSHSIANKKNCQTRPKELSNVYTAQYTHIHYGQTHMLKTATRYHFVRSAYLSCVHNLQAQCTVDCTSLRMPVNAHM